MVLIRAGNPSLAALEPDDGDLLCRFFARLSPETVHRRFLGPVARPERLRSLLEIDHGDREAVCAVVEGEIVGVARYARLPGREAADLSVVVADAWQRQGIATRLLAAVGERARRAGIGDFEVMTLAENRPALALLRRLRPEARPELCGMVYETTVAIGRNE